jgi:fructose/tagatose bisphosphate aldolase
MPLAAFNDLMNDAARGGYAVGYFECWNLESLLAVADAAEQMRSPVMLGYSGIYLPHPRRRARDPLPVLAAMGLETCRGLSVPACLLFNESPHFDWVLRAIECGFQAVMYSDDSVSELERIERIRAVVRAAHRQAAAVEAEISALHGVGGELGSIEDKRAELTDVDGARTFVEQTGVDALAVNVGQVHLHGRQTVRLDLDRLKQLAGGLPLPLVLHGATSVAREDVQHAVAIGIRKVNVGSLLKRVYLDALRSSCQTVVEPCNYYEAIGSGLAADVLTSGRIALQAAVADFIKLLGSAGRAA